VTAKLCILAIWGLHLIPISGRQRSGPDFLRYAHFVKNRCPEAPGNAGLPDAPGAAQPGEMLKVPTILAKTRRLSVPERGNEAFIPVAKMHSFAVTGPSWRSSPLTEPLHASNLTTARCGSKSFRRALMPTWRPAIRAPVPTIQHATAQIAAAAAPTVDPAARPLFATPPTLPTEWSRTGKGNTPASDQNMAAAKRPVQQRPSLNRDR
jgi:hypothetical protein